MNPSSYHRRRGSSDSTMRGTLQLKLEITDPPICLFFFPNYRIYTSNIQVLIFVCFFDNYKGILRQYMIVTASVTSRLVLIKKGCLSVSFSLCLSVYLSIDSLSHSLWLGAQQWLSVVLVQFKKAGKRPDMSEKLLTGTYCMRGSSNFCQVGGPGPTARKQLWQRFFSPQLILQ